MNRTDPDCGTTFQWATKAFGPWVGWFGGWSILVTDLLVMASLADIAGHYSLLLVGTDRATVGTSVLMLIGTASIALMSVLAYRGIELAAGFQAALLAVELLALAAFSAASLTAAQWSPPGATSAFNWNWLNPIAAESLGALMKGTLIAVFIYWGWESTVSVNEETRAPQRLPGVSAVLSTLVLVITYLGVSIAGQAVHGPDFLSEKGEDALNLLAAEVLPAPLARLLLVAVLTSVLAAMLTTILPTTRTALSMAVQGALPRHFARVHVRFATPAAATVWTGAISVAVYVVLGAFGTSVLRDSVEALSAVIAFYYGLTCFACVWLNRYQLFDGVTRLLLVGLGPFLGGCAFTALLIGSTIRMAPVPLLIAVGSLVVGVVLMLAQARLLPGFFVSPRGSPSGR